MKKIILLAIFLIAVIDCYSQTNVANSYLSGGNARVVEIKGINGASVYNSDLTASCSANWEPQGSLCNSSNSNSLASNVKGNNNSGATWTIFPVFSDIATGVVVIDFGSSQLIDLLQVYQMFSDGKVTHVEFFSHYSNNLRPTHINPSWVSMGPETIVEPGAISGNNVTQPTNIQIAPVKTRFLKIHVKNKGYYGSINYIELRNIKAFSITPTTKWNTQIYTGNDKTLNNLQVTGNNIKWYSAATGGSLLPSSTSLIDETIYYASQTVNGIESNTRVAIRVNRILDDNSVTLIPGNTINNIITAPSTNTTSQWFTSAVGGNRVLDSQLLTGGTYYLQQHNNEFVSTLSTSFNVPRGIAIDKDSFAYISDGNEDLVSYKYPVYFYNVGSGFFYPLDTALDITGKIYIADTGNDLIKKMNYDGTNIQIIGSGFNSPTGIEVDASGIIYVVDNGNNAIKKMNNDGSNIQTIASGLNSPYGIAVDTFGVIYVTDGQTIKKMNNDGTNIETITLETGSVLRGICVDNSGVIYVADIGNDIIRVMNNDGTNLHSLGNQSEFDNPYGVALDVFGNLYVTDSGNNALKAVQNIKTSNRIPVTINMSSIAPPPITNWQTQVYTGDDKKIISLEIIGTNIIWYDAPEGGNVLPITTPLVDETTYYASQTISGIESNIRTAITVNRISDKTQYFSSSKTVNNLISTPTIGTTAQWFVSSSGGTILSGTDALSIGTYYVEQYNNVNTTTLGSGFSLPSGVAVDESGYIYVADYGNFAIKKMNNDGTNIQNLGSGFAAPAGVTVDALGFIYVADTANGAIKKMNNDGTNIQTIGSGFSSPSDVVVDAFGVVYFVDRGNNVVKRMNNDGTNIQIIGSGFNQPFGIAVDTFGFLYITDIGNNTVKKMNSDGTNIQILGSGFNIPTRITIDNFQNIYIADSGNNVVKKMKNDGTNIQIIASGLNNLSGITLDSFGGVYVSNNNTVKKILPEIISNRVPVYVISVPAPKTFWPLQIYTGDDKALAELQITGNNIAWYDSEIAGNLLPITTPLIDEVTYYASQTISGIESVTRTGITVNRISDNTQELVPGNSVTDLISNESTGTIAQWYATSSGGIPLEAADLLNNNLYYVEQYSANSSLITVGNGFSYPYGVATDHLGTIYVAESITFGGVKKMNNDGTNIQTIGSGFTYPPDIAIDNFQNIYIVDSGHRAIKKMNNNGTNIQIINSEFYLPICISLDNFGNIYVADYGANSVKKMNSDGTDIQTLATGFSQPQGIAVDDFQNIYIADSGNNAIKKMNNDGTNIQTIGSGFNLPSSIALDGFGNIYVTEQGTNVVKKMNNDGTNIQIIASGLNNPTGIEVDDFGIVYIIDRGNNSVKKIIQEVTSNRVPVIVKVNCDNSTTWNGTSWSNGTPNNSKEVVFTGNYTGPGFNACKVVVNGNAIVTINANTTLNVLRNVIVAPTGTLELQNNAYLIQQTNELNTGNIIVNRNSTPMIRLDYTGWGTPVTGQNLLSFSPNTLTNRFFTYNPGGTNTATAWSSIDPSINDFTTGKGFLIRVANNWSSTNALVYSGVFNGVPNNGDIITPVGVGINFIGNPYPSAINANAFINDNASLGVSTLYFWSHAVPQNSSYVSQSNYASYTTLGGTAAIAGGVQPDNFIQLGQGFFTNATIIGDVVFLNKQRVTTSNFQFFRTANTIERHRFWLSLSDNSNNYNQILLGYTTDATNSYDQGIDGQLFTNASSSLSSLINGDRFVIQGRALLFNDTDEVELSFEADHDGEYYITLDSFDGLFSNQNIYLWDKFLNLYHDIKQGSYAFNTLSGIYNDRFSIVYKVNILSNENFEQYENTIIYINELNNIVIKNYDTQLDAIEIFDITGRLLFIKTDINNNQEIVANNFATNVLIIKSKSILGNITIKKIIK